MKQHHGFAASGHYVCLGWRTRLQQLAKLGLPLLLGLLCSVTSVMAQGILRLATTTSTDQSGLLAAILPAFEQASGLKVQVIAVGSGKAFELGRQGDVDVVLAHARAAEDLFVASGYGINRRDVMANDFVLLGPKADPAKVGGLRDILLALQKVRDSGARFISRGDHSGTDQMEQAYWQQIGSKPQGRAYVSAGQGMGEVLGMADQLDAYTLSDRATHAAYRGKTGLLVLVEGDRRLQNPYGIIAVNPARFTGGGRPINYAGAMKLIDWMTSSAGQKQIADFKIQGKTVFFPTAKPTP